MSSYQQRNNSIDAIKGTLILLVILGHLLLGTIEESITRYLINAFHMCLFMFISGYLINLQKLITLSGKELFIHYWGRMLKMWLIAFIVFSLYQIFKYPNIKQICYLIYTPWYHLWYIPTLFSYIIITRFLISQRLNPCIFYGTLILLYFIWFFMQKYTCPLPRWFDFIQLPYFALGLYLRNHINKQYFQKVYWLAPILFFPAILAMRWLPIQGYGIIPFIIIGIFIVLYLYPAIKADAFPKSMTLSYIGKNSLNIYLWHMIFIQPVKDYSPNTTIYYAITGSLFLIFVLFVNYLANKHT